MTLEQLFNDTENDDLLATDNAEDYKGWLIYDKGGETIASKLFTGGVELLHVMGTGSVYRQAMKNKIDGGQGNNHMTLTLVA